MKDQVISPVELANVANMSPINRALNDGIVWGSVLYGAQSKTFTLTLEDHDGNLFASGICTCHADVEGGFPDGMNFDTDMFSQNDFTINEGNGAFGFGNTQDETDSATFLYAVTTFAMSLSGKDRDYYSGLSATNSVGYRRAWLEIQPRIRRIYISEADTGMTIRNAPVISEYTSFPLTYGSVVAVDKRTVGTAIVLGPVVTDQSSTFYLEQNASADVLALIAQIVDETADRVLVQERGTGINLTADGIAYSGPCILRRVVINTGTAGACIIYDNTAASGTIIATIAGANPGQYEYGVICANGVYVNLTAGQDVTVVVEPV